MKATISQTVPLENRSSERDREKFQLQVRRAINAVRSFQPILRTAGAGGLTTVWLDSEPLLFDSDAVLQAKIKGLGVTSPAVFAVYEAVALFSRGTTGAAAQRGTTQTKVTMESNAAIGFALGVDATSRLFVQVDDGAQGAMDWKVWIEARTDTP